MRSVPTGLPGLTVGGTRDLSANREDATGSWQEEEELVVVFVKGCFPLPFRFPDRKWEGLAFVVGLGGDLRFPRNKKEKKEN